MAETVLPLPDAESHRRLAAAGRSIRPRVWARDRVLPLTDPLREQLPPAALVRGSVVTVDGALGGGSSSVALQIAAAATRAGEWAAVVDPAGVVGGLAVLETGAAVERLVVLRGVPRARWAKVVASLLDGMSVVVGLAPPALRPGDARRLLARARERDAVLVVRGPWPAEAALRLSADTEGWSGLDAGSGWLRDRALVVRAAQHGMALQQPRSATG